MNFRKFFNQKKEVCVSFTGLQPMSRGRMADGSYSLTQKRPLWYLHILLQLLPRGTGACSSMETVQGTGGPGLDLRRSPVPPQSFPGALPHPVTFNGPQSPATTQPCTQSKWTSLLPCLLLLQPLVTTSGP